MNGWIPRNAINLKIYKLYQSERRQSVKLMVNEFANSLNGLRHSHFPQTHPTISEDTKSVGLRAVAVISVHRKASNKSKRQQSYAAIISPQISYATLVQRKQHHGSNELPMGHHLNLLCCKFLTEKHPLMFFVAHLKAGACTSKLWRSVSENINTSGQRILRFSER